MKHTNVCGKKDDKVEEKRNSDAQKSGNGRRTGKFRSSPIELQRFCVGFQVFGLVDAKIALGLTHIFRNLGHSLAKNVSGSNGEAARSASNDYSIGFGRARHDNRPRIVHILSLSHTGASANHICVRLHRDTLLFVCIICVSKR